MQYLAHPEVQRVRRRSRKQATSRQIFHCAGFIETEVQFGIRSAQISLVAESLLIPALQARSGVYRASGALPFCDQLAIEDYTVLRTISSNHLHTPCNTERSNSIDVRAAELIGIPNENTPCI